MIFLLKLLKIFLDGTRVNRRLMKHMNVDVMVATSGGF
jgi:hypothetical protein